jgi:Xaa-Pro aminopeptidase
MTTTRTDSLDDGLGTAERIAAIERAAELVAVGHAAVREALQPGATELDLWAAAQAAIEAVTGEPVHAVVDLMVGARTALVGEPPGTQAVAAGDPVLFDLAPRRDGYYADSCATFVCGIPTSSAGR